MIEFFSQYKGVKCISSDSRDQNLSFKFSKTNPEQVIDNRKKFFKKNNLDLDSLVQIEQPHKNKVVVAKAAMAGRGAYGKDWIKGADALVTDQKNLILGIEFADCLPLFLYNEKQGIIAAAHLGWRSIASELVANLAKTINTQYNITLKDFQAIIGPHIHKCCYTHSEEVADVFANYKNAVIYQGDQIYLDLQSVVREQLLAHELQPENLQLSDLCTGCDEGFFSCRRQKENWQAEMLGLITLL